MKFLKLNSHDFILVSIILFVGIFFVVYFKTKHAMNFLNLDELLWMYRSRFFMDDILSLQFSNLIQSSQPGVMVMWAVGPFMRIINYDFNIIVNLISELNVSGVGYNIINSSTENQQIYHNYRGLSFLFNIPIVAIMTSFILALYYLLRRLLFNKWQITFSLLLIVTTPYYVYFTTPTDKFVGMFSTISILCLIIYLGKKGGKLFLVMSAVLGSWAVLSKMSSLFLLPFVFFAIIYYSNTFNLLFHRVNQISGVKRFINELRHILCIYLAWILVFILTSIIFLPTIITNPRSVWSLLSRESSQRAIVENHNSFIGTKVLFSYLTDDFLLSFNVFVILIFIVYFCLILRKIKDKIYKEKETVVLYLYFLSFFIFIILFSKTYSFRYLVPVLIIFQIVAGLGIYEIVNLFIKKNNIKDKRLIYYWAILSVLLSQILLIYYSEIEKIESLPYFG
ncbi:glycosyltransferase family 39 protein [Patescibacteria group bacterium]|nr:glycosyltransferase family 39 protein [Patescibacteria group bacterium]